jgi:hypothetical protein
MANFGDKKKSATWGQGGIVGGGTKHNEIKLNDKFTVLPNAGLNQKKANVKTDKPYDGHISGK